MSIKKIIFIVVGCICLALGSIGVVLPILPTTPFLLVSAYCFARSSKRLNNWFKGTKLYKNNLESFQKGEGMTIKTKVKIMSMVTLLMVIAFIMMKNTLVGRICISVVWVAHVIAFVFFIKTKKEDKKVLKDETLKESTKSLKKEVKE